MLDWIPSLFPTPQPDVAALVPVPPAVDPSTLPYEASRIMLNKETDAPFLNEYWNYPLKGVNAPEIVYSDRINHTPLFSSKDQLLDSASECIGKLHFTRSIHPHNLSIDPTDRTVVTKPLGYVVSGIPAAGTAKCASIRDGASVHAGFRIGGSGPGGPEMSAKQLGGTMTSKLYQQLGPHSVGKVLKNGTVCIDPSAMEMRENVVYNIRDDDGLPQDSLIQTS